jgi:hypothetical protein
MRRANSEKTEEISLLTYRKYFFFSASFSSARIIGRSDYIIERIFKRNGRSSHEICSRVRKDINIVKKFWRNSRVDFSCARIERNLKTDVKGSRAGTSAAFFLRNLAALFGPIALEAIF